MNGCYPTNRAARMLRGAMDAFLSSLAPLHVHPLWRQQGLLLSDPTSRAIPYLWKYAPVRERLLEAGRLITAEEAERRVLILRNPGLGGEPAATKRLYAGLQLVMPGEIAPAHHHGASAIRFVVEGRGAYTTVDGERAIMSPGDLVLTPCDAIHDHGNESDTPMIWLDGLDLPMINMLECAWFEGSGEKVQSRTRPDDASVRLYANAAMRPSWIAWTKNHSPVNRYPYELAERTLLSAWRDGAKGSPEDGILFEYSNPITGGPALPTMACLLQLLPPRTHTAAHRHTTSAVYHVVRGRGASIIDGQRIEWEPRDTFALPGWAVHEHESIGDEPAILFVLTDEPALRALGFLREESMPRQE